MLVLDDLPKLIRQIDDLKQQRDELQGAIKEKLKTLKGKFNCDDLEEAKKLLEKLEKEKEKIYQKYTKMRKVFNNKWKKVLK